MQGEEIKTVLVTGANGFIGARVCRLLAASGYAIRIICRETSDLTLLEDIPYSKFMADITSPETLELPIKGSNYIIHLAGLIKANTEADFMKVNQGGTVNLLNAVKNNNLDLKKFVLVSSAAGSGVSYERPRKEDDPPEPLTPYGRSKLAGEEVTKQFRDLIPITIIRPPAVYGPGDKETFAFFNIVNKGFKPFLGGGRNRIQMVHVDDLAEGIIKAMESDKSRGKTYFIAEDRAYSIREMLNIIAEVMGKKGIGISIPRLILKFLALLSELFHKLIGKVPMFSRPKVKELLGNWEFDLTGAREDLEYESKIDFKSGAMMTIDWYREKRWLK